MPAPKKTELPALEDWHAPWEVNDDGDVIPEDEQTVDTGKLRKYLHGLLKDKNRLQAKVETLTGERDDLKGKIDEQQREGESETDRLKRENAELQKKIDAGPEVDVEKLRLEAALEVGLPRKHVGRLNRDLTDLDDLIEDAKELQASFGGAGDTDNDGEKDKDTPRGRPRPVRTPGDPKGGRSDKEVSVEDVLSAVPVGGF